MIGPLGLRGHPASRVALGPKWRVAPSKMICLVHDTSHHLFHFADSSMSTSPSSSSDACDRAYGLKDAKLSTALRSAEDALPFDGVESRLSVRPIGRPTGRAELAGASLEALSTGRFPGAQQLRARRQQHAQPVQRMIAVAADTKLAADTCSASQRDMPAQS